MLVKTCLSSILSTRFDFGVPLEDVFPPNDVHPRLKYLFGKAYESYLKHGGNIEIILRQEQGSLKERLKLKEKLVLDLDYHINVEEFSPGTYFWVIRHFLGLLPLPLLPKFSRDFQFEWEHLAKECKNFLQKCGDEEKNKHVLDKEIALSLNMLPFENFILLNVLIAFIRRLTTKNIRGRQIFNRNSVLILTKYYCSSIFVRPFRPGYYVKNGDNIPLLLYLILRWQKISKHSEIIGHPAYFLECDFKNIECFKSLEQRDSCTQTNILSNGFFNPDVISVCKNIPYFVNICNNYFKDIGCQTDINLCQENNIECYLPILEESEESVSNLDTKDLPKSTPNETNINANNEKYKLAYIEKEPNKVSRQNDVENDNNNTLYQTATDFSLTSVINKDEQQDWQNIVKETMDTVKRIEESYIYDDYETFRKEDFNQIGKRSFLSKISKYGFTYTPSKNSAHQEIRQTSTPEKESPKSDISYVKYPDVCEDVDVMKDHSNACEYQKTMDAKGSGHGTKGIKQKTPVSHTLFQNDSPVNVLADNSKQSLQNDGSSKKRNKYVLKRIRLSLEFLRALTPKKGAFKRIESRVKYYRMKNSKSHTI